MKSNEVEWINRLTDELNPESGLWSNWQSKEKRTVCRVSSFSFLLVHLLSLLVRDLERRETRQLVSIKYDQTSHTLFLDSNLFLVVTVADVLRQPDSDSNATWTNCLSYITTCTDFSFNQEQTFVRDDHRRRRSFWSTVELRSERNLIKRSFKRGHSSGLQLIRDGSVISVLINGAKLSVHWNKILPIRVTKKNFLEDFLVEIGRFARSLSCRRELERYRFDVFDTHDSNLSWKDAISSSSCSWTSEENDQRLKKRSRLSRIRTNELEEWRSGSSSHLRLCGNKFFTLLERVDEFSAKAKNTVDRELKNVSACCSFRRNSPSFS